MLACGLSSFKKKTNRQTETAFRWSMDVKSVSPKPLCAEHWS